MEKKKRYILTNYLSVLNIEYPAIVMYLTNIRTESRKGLSQLEKENSHANMFPILSRQEDTC